MTEEILTLFVGRPLDKRFSVVGGHSTGTGFIDLFRLLIKISVISKIILFVYFTTLSEEGSKGVLNRATTAAFSIRMA